MKTKILYVMLAMCIASAVSADSPFQAAAHFSLGFPKNEFGDNLDAIGIGGGGNFFYRIPQTGVLLGAGIDFYVYGSETRKEPWSLTIPDVYVNVTRTNSIFQGFLMLRLQPQNAKLTPYAEGLFGFNYLSTSTSVKAEWSDDDDEIASSTNYDDSALCYGGGAGLLFRIFKSPESPDPMDKNLSVYIDFGFKYIKGGEAKYLKKGDIEIDNNSKVQFSPRQSTTDLLAIHIGLSFNF